MTKAIDLGTLFAETELPFGHPGRNFDDTPAGYSDFDDRYEPWPVDPSRSSPSRNCCPERGQTIRAWPRIPPSAAHPGAGVPPGLSPGSPSRPTSLK